MKPLITHTQQHTIFPAVTIKKKNLNVNQSLTQEVRNKKDGMINIDF